MNRLAWQRAVTIGFLAFVVVLFSTLPVLHAQTVWVNQKSNIAENLYCIAYGNGLFVAGAADGTIITSPDGITWTPRARANAYCKAATYGNGRFVVCVNDDTVPYWTSDDGVTWTPQPIHDPSGQTSITVANDAVAYGNGIFVAIGIFDSSVAFSLDGLYWQTANGYNSVPGYPGNGKAITFDDFTGKFFSAHLRGRVATTTDGLSWAVPANSDDFSDDMSGIAAANNIIVVVGSARVFTSSDSGTSFIARGNPTHDGNQADFTAVTYGSNHFVAVCGGGEIYSSVDGVVWTYLGTYASGDTLNAITHGLDTFATVGDFPHTSGENNGMAWLYTSADGSGTPLPKSSALINISTRLDVLTGDNVLIGGFIITGNAPKRVLLRAIGPSLGNFGVQGLLADPILELHYPDGSTVINDDWRETQQSEIIETTIPPSNDLESAIVETLAPGGYTAIVRGFEDGTGLGLVEAYDLDQSSDSELANISTRGSVKTGDGVLISGFFAGDSVDGDTTVVIRGLGPSLTGIVGTPVLADPMLELFDSNGVMVISNDNWLENPNAFIIVDNNLIPADDLESAIAGTFPAGSYTVILRGASNGTGVGLLEVYNVK